MALALLLYVAIAVFALGNLYRIGRIVRMPAHLRWDLYPMPRGPRARRRHGGSYFEESEWWTKPAASSRGSELAFILAEVLWLRTLWRRQRRLWFWSWLFHVGLYSLVITTLLSVLAAAKLEPARMIAAVRWTAWVGACAGGAGAVGLLAMRIGSARLRPYSSRADIFNLLLTSAIFLTAAGMVWSPGMPQQMVAFLEALIRKSSPPALPRLAVAHVALIAGFVAYFPFTHMTHAYMKFFAFHAMRWDDAPLVQNRATEGALARNFARPISWSAPHIDGDGRQTTWSGVLRPQAGEKR